MTIWKRTNVCQGNPSRTEYALLDSLLEQYQERVKRDDNALRINSLLRSDLGALLPLHVSLSRPVVLTTDERSAFADIFGDAIQKEHFAS
jgi:U6 snRNA phosphodiesterase